MRSGAWERCCGANATRGSMRWRRSLVVAAGLALGISADDWKWLVLAMVSVWGAEALNTALELLADAAKPEFHPLVKQAKDVAAGAVLIAAIGAAVIGALIFIPAAVSRLPAVNWRSKIDGGIKMP